MFTEFDDGFTLRYRVLLSLLVIIALASQTFTILQIEANQSSAQIINDAGKQRMFSQRIASFTLQLKEGNVSARPMLQKTLEQFRRHHLQLNKKIELRNRLLIYRLIDIQYARVVSATIASHMIENYLANTEILLTKAPESIEFKNAFNNIVSQANEPILNAIEKMVYDEQQIAETQIARIHKTQKIGFFAILVTSILGLFTVFHPMARNATYLRRLASIDALTGTLNRRAFIQRAEDELLRSKRYLKPISLLAIDVDHFKQINDRYGHSGGDAALVALANTLQQQLRSSDAIGRWGGEEFLIILAETNTKEAKIVAERYRQLLSDLMITYGTEAIKFTVSIGISSFENNIDSKEMLIEQADKALYEAKRNGRNQVVVYYAGI